MRARRGLCGAARPRRVVKEPQFMNSEFTTQLWCLDALLSRGPGERPGRPRAIPARRRHGAVKIAVRSCVRSGYPGRAPAPIGELGHTVLIHAAPPHPTRQAGRLTAATGPVDGHPTGDRPTLPLDNFSLLGDGVEATPDTAGAAVRHRTPRAARTGRADQAPGGHSAHHIYPPAAAPGPAPVSS